MPTGETDVGPDDRAAILAAAADYIESWLDGDAARMGRCLHPNLMKRGVEVEQPTAQAVLTSMTREDMVAATTQGHGRRHERPYEATILDAFGDLATVRLLSSVYTDYLHVARVDGCWRLVNVLWQRRPGR